MTVACTSPLKAWQLKAGGDLLFDPPPRSDAFRYRAVEVRCRKCLSCRLHYGSTWSNRIVQEASMHKANCVVTLTYSPENLPEGGALRYRDVQLFLKRFRKAHAGASIMYLVVGEYGDQGGRPHYHMIVFGLDFEDKSYWQKSASGSKLWKSAELDRLWGLGHTVVGEVDKESADYVGRYAVKKVTGDLAEIHYRRVDLETGEIYQLPPEFLHCSKGRARPGEEQGGRGIGARWLKRYWSDVFPGDRIVHRGGFESAVPDYYMKLLRRRDAELFDQLKAKRRERAEDPAFLADQTPERRAVHAVVAQARMAMKRRKL